MRGTLQFIIMNQNFSPNASRSKFPREFWIAAFGNFAILNLLMKAYLSEFVVKLTMYRQRLHWHIDDVCVAIRNIDILIATRIYSAIICVNIVVSVHDQNASRIFTRTREYVLHEVVSESISNLTF